MADALTADLPAAAVARPGAIILARHGEPAISRKVRLSSDDYRDFWARYETLGLREGQAPPPALTEAVAQAGVVLSSTRKRSIETAKALVGAKTFTTDPMFVEAPLPPPNFPSWVRLSPSVWGFLARFWWWFFNHNEGSETRRQAEVRADEAAARLIDLTAGGDDVVVLAHGFFNFMIGRALVRRGWRMTTNGGYKYWSNRRFERN